MSDGNIREAFDGLGTAVRFNLPDGGEPLEYRVQGISQPLQLPSATLLPAVIGAESWFSLPTINTLLRNHDVTFDQILSIKSPSWDISRQDLEELDPYTILTSLVHGMEWSDRAGVHSIPQDVDFPVKIALLSSCNPENWLHTRLNHLQKAADAGKAPDISTLAPDFGYREVHSFGHDTRLLPNRNCADMLIRSGILHPCMTRKTFSTHGILENAIFWASISNGIWDKVIEAGIELQNPKRRDAFGMALKHSIPAVVEELDELPGMYHWLEAQLEDTELNAILESSTMKINYLPNEEYLIPKLEAEKNTLSTLLNQRDSLMDMLAEDISNTPSDELSLAHFSAMTKIAGLGFEQRSERHDYQELTEKMLGAVSLFYGSANAVAKDGLKDMVSLVLKKHELDCTPFKALSSDMVAVLVKAGVDPRQLPKMNIRDMHDSFTSQLNI